MPPSPRLSARIMKVTYLIVTTIIRAQIIRETNAEDLGLAHRAARGLAERGLEAVERAGADVAEHDADRTQGEAGIPLALGHGVVGVTRFRRGLVHGLAL